MLRSAEAITVVELHEETFLARYERLLGWALHLTGGDREQAEDLVHDAFIQYTFSRPDLAGIQNLDAYLYTMLRNLRLSQIRRRQRLPGQSLSALQYDSAELSLRAVDPRDQIRVQDELRQICRYACIRKETSKAGSVLLLRFMLGYYPREIAQVMRGSRQAAEERLRAARGEARLFLENPGGLRFLGRPSEVSAETGGYARTSEELLRELRQTVFRSCHGDCPSDGRLAVLYRDVEASIEAETLAHTVSCPRCLDAVNRLLGLPLLSERYPTDTLGTDTRPKGGGGGGGGTLVPSKEHIARRCRRRALETFEHRPQELRISVNGYVMASQKIGQPLSEQALNVAAVEKIDFVEVFSEQDVRLLLLCVDEQPPEGPHRRSVKVELSDGRMLEATLSFSSPWPTVQIAYHDPLSETEAAAAQEQPAHGADSSDATAEGAESAETGTAAGRKQVWRRLPGALAGALRGLARPGFWLRPGAMTAAASLVFIGVALLYLYLHKPVVSAAELLERSVAAEKATVADAGLVLHRTISLEARRPGTATPERRRIEVWQSAARDEKVRRVYDEWGALLAGEWENSGGAGTVYRRGGAAQKQTKADAPTSLLSADDIWRIELSSGEFSALVGGAARVSAEESAAGYILNYAGRADAASPRLINATLILSKGDLRATSQTLVVEGTEGKREYRFVETGFSRQEAGSVDPAVFRPERELLSDSGESGRPSGETLPPDGAFHQPLAGASPVAAVASAELEIEVNYLLDQIKANLGEQVSVERTTGGKLRVEALVETVRRKEEILRALGSILNNPAVVVEVSTIDEALRRRKGKAATSGEEVQEVEVATARIPADEDLRRYFSARIVGAERIDEEIERFATRAMGRSRQALMHASALKRLAGRFSPAETRSLTPEARAKWQTMIREHARGYREQTAALRRELRPIFSTGGGGEGARASADDESLRQDAERLLRFGYAHDEAVRSAFTLSDGAGASVSLKSPQFWRSLAAAESLAEAIEVAYQQRRE